MIYLDSITLLDYALKKLNADKRDQVSVSMLPEIKQVVAVATTKVGADQSVAYRISHDDLLEALMAAQSLSGMKNLTEKMKQTIVDGVRTMKHELCVKAYDYYSMHDFEPTEANIPILREIVRDHLFGG